MSKYAKQHANAYRKVMAKGAELTFEGVTAGHQDSSGVFHPPTRKTLDAVATDDQGDGKEFEAAGMTVVDGIRLLVITETYGDAPELNMTTVWGGESMTVKAVNSYKPDGTTLFTYVILA